MGKEAKRPYLSPVIVGNDCHDHERPTQRLSIGRMTNGRTISSSDAPEKVQNGSETLGDGIKKPISEQNSKPLSAEAKSRRSRRYISSCPSPVIEQDPTRP
jgi:hypothetical protein